MTETDPVSPAQSRAVHAYAGALLEPAVAAAAAEDAIAAFRQTLKARGEAAGDPASPVANETLLALTRLMTAVSMPDRSSPEDRRQAVWASIGSASHCTCRESAALLATRANGNIQPRENVALDEHLAGCADCRELSVRSTDADRAFRDELAPPRGGGGFGLAGVPRAAYAVTAVVIAVGAGVFALTSGGSSSHTARAVAVPIQTQTAARVALTVPTTPALVPVHRHPRVVKKKKPAHHTVTHTDTVAKTVTSTPATDTTPPASTASTAGTTDSGTPTSDAGATAPSAATSSAGTPAASSTAAAPSTAAVVSGQSSLPAESAPQQGIGNLTSTTP